MLERVKEKFEIALKKADNSIPYIEDAYRLQTAIDDHIRRMEELEEYAKEMVKDLESIGLTPKQLIQIHNNHAH